MFAEMLEKAKEEATRIIEDAKAKTAPKKEVIENVDAESLVTHTFFKDNGDYSDDVFISVNGECIVCQRGVPVKIKRKFLWAYEQAQAQEEKAANMITRNTNRYEQRAREFNI